MAGQALTSASTLQCPHGGQVQVVPANTRAKVDAFLLTQADTFTIVGCPFTIPPGVVSPCLTVQWLVTEQRAKAGGAALLSQGDTGLCMSGMSVPQGPVSIVTTQTRVKTQ